MSRVPSLATTPSLYAVGDIGSSVAVTYDAHARDRNPTRKSRDWHCRRHVVSRRVHRLQFGNPKFPFREDRLKLLPSPDDRQDTEEEQLGCASPGTWPASSRYAIAAIMIAG
jgi:hypothetical protein